MSKAGKKRKHDEKMKKKKAIKAQRKAAYAALAGTGKTKNKKARLSPVSSNLKHAHAMVNCGNWGCDRCFPKGKISKSLVSAS
jgi:hypothetical protein